MGRSSIRKDSPADCAPVETEQQILARVDKTYRVLVAGCIIACLAVLLLILWSLL